MDLKGLLSRRPHLVPVVIAAVMLLGGLAKWPYGYYILLRWFTCAAAIFVAYCCYTWKSYWATWLFGLLAALFNPVLPVHFSRQTWQVLDVAGALALVGAVVMLWKPDSQDDTLFTRLRFTIKGIDPFYADVKTEQVALYQHYFGRMLNAVDMANLTSRSRGRDYCEESLETDYTKLDVILREAAAEGLIAHYLQVLLEQYVWADERDRECHKDDWVTTAMRWRTHGFIPDPAQISRDFFVEGHADHQASGELWMGATEDQHDK